MQPISVRRIAGTRQLGTALVAGLLISSALWLAVLGLTGNLPGAAPQRGNWRVPGHKRNSGLPARSNCSRRSSTSWIRWRSRTLRPRQ